LPPIENSKALKPVRLPPGFSMNTVPVGADNGHHGQSADEFRDQAIFQQVPRLHLAENFAGAAVFRYGHCHVNGICLQNPPVSFHGAAAFSIT
jgi:hypothetical protein